MDKNNTLKEAVQEYIASGEAGKRKQQGRWPGFGGDILTVGFNISTRRYINERY